MADFTAKDVQALRQSAGAGMMDAKKALTETDGDMEAARKLLREERGWPRPTTAGRENAQGAIALASDVNTVGLVELKCETDFVAKSDNFIRLTQELADSVAARGRGAVGNHKDEIDDLKVALKENIEVGRAVQISVEAGQIVDTYLHRQARPGRRRGGRRDRGRLQGAGARPRGAHRLRQVPVPAAGRGPGRPGRGGRRHTLLTITKAEGKPEPAWPKIVEGRGSAGTRSGCCSSSPSSLARRSRPWPSWPGRWGRDRPLRPALHRRLRKDEPGDRDGESRHHQVPPDPAEAVGRGLRRRRRLRHRQQVRRLRGHERSPTSARRASTSPWSSAAATSGAG